MDFHVASAKNAQCIADAHMALAKVMEQVVHKTKNDYIKYVASYQYHMHVMMAMQSRNCAHIHMSTVGNKRKTEDADEVSVQSHASKPRLE